MATAAEPDTPAVEEDDGSSLSNWEFLDRVPTTEEVLVLLKGLPPVWGIDTADFADYVQVLPSQKKVKVKAQKNGREVVNEEYHDIATIYMSVAGRIKMLEAAAAANGWLVDFEPEPETPTGVPGMLRMDDDRIVYREYVVILEPIQEGPGPATMRRKGRKPGTAWVPASGGRQAAGSNPYEKVETSARGRAIAAWGFGVLPGSGVASYEEMQGLSQNRAALRDDAPSAPNRRPRGEIMLELLGVAETIRQIRGISQLEMNRKIAKYLKDTFQIDAGAEHVDESGETVLDIEWARVRDGHLTLTLGEMKRIHQSLVDAEAPV